MRLLPRSTTFLVVSALLSAILVRAFAWNATRGFAPFAQDPRPQRVLGDFDGDGRSDIAAIEESAGGPSITVRLSGSSGVTDLETTAAALIKTDIDHDGDLDLVAITPTGELVILINDGRGRFTRQPASHQDGISAVPTLVDRLVGGTFALRAFEPFQVSMGKQWRSVIAAPIRPPTGPRAFDARSRTLLALRAPPLGLA
jgi:hypothetical protein